MSKKKIIIYLVLIIIFGLITYFGYKIYKTLSDNKKIEDEIIKIKDEVIINKNDDITPNEEDNNDNNDNNITIETEKLTMDFNKLKSINNDTVAWIKINNTNIDYPVVKTNNNEYYLNHSFYKYSNINGWIFLNSENDSNFTDENTVIFGHNTNSYTMFSELRDIYKGNLGNSIYINIYTEKDSFTYQVFSIYLENPNNTSNISKYINQSTIVTMKNKSKINFDINVSKDDKILTLSTCNNITNDRLVMHAKKI